MSYYYQHAFTSPEAIYAVVMEELKSYTDTSAIDSLLFPTYVDKCLRKLGKTSYPIKDTLLDMEDFTSRLPDDFHAVREAWLCAEIELRPYQEPRAFYSQTDDPTTILVSPLITDEAELSPDTPSLIQAVYKTSRQVARTLKKQYLLKPGNISAKNHCDVEYTSQWNMYSPPASLSGNSSIDSFDIHDNKLITNFRKGVIYLVYYADSQDSEGNQLIPDNYYIREYIEAFLKYKIFETLLNQTNDETFPQLEKKLGYYKQLSDEAYILALTEVKKQTVYQKQRAIRKNLNRMKMYELPTRSRRY